MVYAPLADLLQLHRLEVKLVPDLILDVHEALFLLAERMLRLHEMAILLCRHLELALKLFHFFH